MTNPDSTRFMLFADEQKTMDGAEAMLLDMTDLYDTAEPVFSMTITLAGQDKYLGSCGLSPTDEEGVVEILFTLVPAAQGHGYATEAVEALIDHTRDKGAKRLIAKVFEGNRPSVGVLQRAGFALTDTVDGEFGPTLVYELTL